MGEALADPGSGGGRHTYSGEVIPGIHTYNIDFWLRDMGGDPMHWEDPGGFCHRFTRRVTGKQPQQLFDGNWQYLPVGGISIGSGLGGDRNPQIQEIEHCGIVHCY